jgi:hypothetical protein
MPYASTLETAAARSAISKGDLTALERYLRDGGNNPVVSITTATATLIPGTNLYNKADGITGTLPAATGSQAVVRVVIQTAITSSNAIIKVANTTDVMVGMLTYATTTFAAGSTEAAGGTDDTITLTAASGGVKGTVITLTDIASGLWLVDGLLASTTGATALSATV